MLLIDTGFLYVKCWVLNKCIEGQSKKGYQ